MVQPNLITTHIPIKRTEFLTTNHFKYYEIYDYILSYNSELSLDSINIFNPFIKLNNTKISIFFILLT